MPISCTDPPAIAGSPSRKILIFAPFGDWVVHHQLDCVLGAALLNRGCEVRVMRCDGLFERCMLSDEAPGGDFCRRCRKQGDVWFERFGLPVSQMSALLTEADQKEVREWSLGLDVANLPRQRFREWEVGQWMTWALNAKLLVGSPDFSDPIVIAHARDFARHGALMALATRHMLDEFEPDGAICFNGSNSYYRVFFEILRASGRRVLVHERGFARGTFLLLDNVSVYDTHARFIPDWDSRKEAPLTEEQWGKVAELFEARKRGETNYSKIHRFGGTRTNARKRLRLPKDAKILLALPSGDWEHGMRISNGGLQIMWDTQIAWLEDTAEICRRHGWHLVIRLHPLGAGTSNFKRESKFLAELITTRSFNQPHIRVIMPAENLSTYDVMPLAAAAVTQFTTTGAEALIQGLPVATVTDSPYRKLGMKHVISREAYESDLVALMNSGPCVDEATLTQAFRCAYFYFCVVGHSEFQTVRIKNAFEPEFRLDSPAELVPGVDPAIDRVCENILRGTSLYPAPAPEASATSEAALIREHRNRCLAQREAANRDEVPDSFPAVTIWCLGPALKRGQTELPTPADWRCRHKEVTFDWMVLDARGGEDALRLTLEQKTAEAPTPYVYLLPPHVALDESALSQAVDLLEEPENRDKTGVLFGCYVMEGPDARTLGPEWNTATHPPNAAQLPPPGIDCLAEPMTVLSMVFWRREKLADWLEQTLSKHDNDSSWCRDMLASYLAVEKFVNLAEPVIVIRAGESQKEILERADGLSAQGDLEAALKEAATCQERFGFTCGLRGRMASWLCHHQRPAQALALLSAEYRNGRPGLECWDMLRQTLPQLAIKRPGYKDYASAVDTVFGYMVPGQERFLHEKVMPLPQDARILEIGAFFGRSTTAMAFACVGTRRHIFTIDTFWGNEGLMGRTSWFYNHWRGNLRRWGLESYVTACPGFSHPVVRSFAPDEMFDFVFIDASHEYKDVLLDFELVWPHVKPGGWIGFHDVEPGWPGCWRVWHQTGRRLLTDLATCDTLACGRKAADAPWRSYEEEWPGHTASVAQHLAGTEDRKEIGNAMLALMRGETGAGIEAAIAAAPEALRLQFVNAVPEAGGDPWLHRMLGLMLVATDPAAAAHHRDEAARLGK